MFPIPEINETLKDSPHGNFRHCETKEFRQKILKLPPPPPLIQTFSMPEINETLKDSSYEIFRHCETKKFLDGKS